MESEKVNLLIKRLNCQAFKSEVDGYICMI